VRFSKSVFDIIPARRSVRTCEAGPLADPARRELEAFLVALPAPPFGSSVRFVLAAAEAGGAGALEGLGTYGVIRNPAGFVIAAVKPDDAGLFDFGFLMEAVCLKITDLGLGSCWLGASFRKSRFTERIGLRTGEVVPSVLSVGVAAARMRMLERVMRAGAGSGRRLGFETLFFDGGFSRPLSPAAAGAAARPLEMVRLAPSASNRQPWRVVRDSGGSFHFHLWSNAAYQRQLKAARVVNLQAVDLGIAACHFTLAAEESGLRGRWERRPASAPEPPEGVEYVASWITSE
jgi:nitroreductase